MRIGFDLDNIFIDTPPIIPDVVIERLYRKNTKKELLYRIPSKAEQYIRRAAHIRLLRPPIKKNITFLRSLENDSNQLYLISSRYGFLKNVTMGVIKRHKLDKTFHELYFNFENKQPHIFKDEMLKKLKIEKFVDDDLDLLKYIAGKNNSIKLYWLNKKIKKKISNNITAITNIADLLNKP